MSTDTSPAAVEAMCKMLLDKGPNGGHFVQFGPEAAAMLRAVASERDEANRAMKRQAAAVRTLHACEATEINRLREKTRVEHVAVATLDSEKEANARLTDALLAAEAEAAALREALTLAANRLERMLVDLIASGSPLRWEASDWVDAARKAALKENHDGL